MTQVIFNHKLRISIGILLFGIGVSSIGDFIYLVTINVYILALTHSATAVAGMWIMARISSLIVSAWSGSITDRYPYRKQLICIEMSRALLIGILPFLKSVMVIYFVLFLLGTCTTFFGNAFLPFQTLIIPSDSRNRFNSISSLLRYGSFLIGPAIAGILLSRNMDSIALWIDSASFLFSALTIAFLPNVTSKNQQLEVRKTKNILIEDWKKAIVILKNNILFTTLYSLNFGISALSLAADTQEVVFATNALKLGQSGYSIMVVAAGIGFISGSFLLSIISKHLDTKWMIGIGVLLNSIGYVVYSLSHSLIVAVLGLVILGIFGSISNVGYTTFIQSAIPVSYMGRINNVMGPIQQILNIFSILLGGFFTTSFGVRNMMIFITIPMTIIAFVITLVVFMPKNNKKWSEAQSFNE